MNIRENKDGSVSLIIPRPKDMTLERFLVLSARLEKIVDRLGGRVRVIG
tara:strand:- start:825 stop:971 length:147 start_codon:yes stop_codon:yes gene_type:complete